MGFPARFGLGGRLLEVDVLVHVVDPGERYEMMLAGSVRLVELALILLIGAAIYVGYVVPVEGFAWRYVFAIAGQPPLRKRARGCCSSASSGSSAPA